eukprot:TRINITY_DN15025_c0_g1_i1.p1 TRINITY_DN15025_c0_g1~~TRINITY_DN15025_c0_g1_i1.p1  ORF type:complete len:1246 (+),score=230.84 TRINITY_DN15025_c0_g1_i1:92-3829(+)
MVTASPSRQPFAGFGRPSSPPSLVGRPSVMTVSPCLSACGSGVFQRASRSASPPHGRWTQCAPIAVQAGPTPHVLTPQRSSKRLLPPTPKVPMASSMVATHKVQMAPPVATMSQAPMMTAVATMSQVQMAPPVATMSQVLVDPYRPRGSLVSSMPVVVPSNPGGVLASSAHVLSRSMPANQPWPEALEVVQEDDHELSSRQSPSQVSIDPYGNWMRSPLATHRSGASGVAQGLSSTLPAVHMPELFEASEDALAGEPTTVQVAADSPADWAQGLSISQAGIMASPEATHRPEARQVDDEPQELKVWHSVGQEEVSVMELQGCAGDVVAAVAEEAAAVQAAQAQAQAQAEADMKVEAEAEAAAQEAKGVPVPHLVPALNALEALEERRSVHQARVANHMRGSSSALLRGGAAAAVCANGGGRQRPEDARLRSAWWEREPNAPGPITREAMVGTVRTLVNYPTASLPAAFVGRVLGEGAAALRAAKYNFSAVAEVAVPGVNATAASAPGATERTAPPGSRMVLLGDTHGQMEDVLWIFHRHGFPSRSNIYLFNGDIADRGRHALEIFVLALGFMVACPGSVYINRGNHEDSVMNKGGCGGFYTEVLEKYGGTVGGLIYDQLQAIYALLPLATIVNEAVFVVHGGLSRHEDFLGLLRTVHHRQPHVHLDAYDAHGQAVIDALWSDPMDGPGTQASKRGGGICTFGPDVTQRFLEQTGFSLVVRSHEVPPNNDGVYTTHGGKLMTVFSASNYRGTMRNQGAVLILSEEANGQLQAVICRHFAPSLTSDAFRGLSVHEAAAGGACRFATPEAKDISVISEATAAEAEQAAVRRVVQRDPTNARLHADILQEVGHLVVEHKAALWSYLFHHDKEKRGFVDTNVWRSSCRATLGDLPWHTLQPILVGEVDRVDYFDFLHRFRVVMVGVEISDQFSHALMSRIYARIMELPLGHLLKQFDRDGSGTVSVPELREALLTFDSGLTESQAYALLRTMSAHVSKTSTESGGVIDIASFLSRFEVVYRPLAERQREAHWTTDALKRIGGMVWGGSADVGRAAAFRAFFERADVNGDGYLDYNEFRAAIAGVMDSIAASGGTPLNLSMDQLQALAGAVDISMDGRISYMEFISGFSAADSATDQAFHLDVAEQIFTCIWMNRQALLSTCVLHDPHHSGEISIHELAAVLAGMSGASGTRGSPLTEEQIAVLVDHVRFDTVTGRVRYREFLSSFKIVDTAKEHSGVPQQLVAPVPGQPW